MRTILLVLALLVVVGFLVVDGVGMYVAHRTAGELSEAVAEEAAQAYVDADGSEAAAKRAAEAVAAEAGVELLDVTYHRGTTRWYEATVRAEGKSFFLKHLPLVKDRLDWESTAVVHF
jgi:hypothetical protein